MHDASALVAEPLGQTLARTQTRKIPDRMRRENAKSSMSTAHAEPAQKSCEI
jgi:hypothetical protein